MRTSGVVALDAWVRAVCKQETNHLRMAAIGRTVQRRQTVAPPAIHGPTLQQQTNQIEHRLLAIARIWQVRLATAHPSGRIEHAQFGRDEDIQRNATLKQELDHVQVSREVRGVDSLRAKHIRRSRERRVLVQQRRDAIAITLSGGSDDPVNLVRERPG